MRPRGEIRQALAAALQAGPAWPVTIADRTGLATPVVREVLNNMRRAGEVAVFGEQRLPGSNRPARVYGLVEVGGRSTEADGLNWDLIDCWAKFPAVTRQAES